MEHADHVHQCPSCPITFHLVTELDWHLRAEHPDHHHDYSPAHTGVPGSYERGGGSPKA